MTIKVVYITGVFRSGSTLFDTILGNTNGVMSVGELVNVQELAWSKGEYCSCGKKGDECEFWKAVYLKWTKRFPNVSIQTFSSIQHKVERFRYWPSIFIYYIYKPSFVKNYIEYIQALYECISEVSGCNVIVDSSKNPGRALALTLVPKIDLYVIHFIRDGRGVAWSCLRKFEVDLKKGLQRKIDPIPVWKTAIRWVTINVSSSLILLFTRVKSIRIHYEYLVNNTRSTLSKTSEFVDIDTDKIIKVLDESRPISPQHTIAGNRMRMNKQIKITIDDEWRTKMSKSDLKLFWLLAGITSRFYGYNKY